MRTFTTSMFWLAAALLASCSDTPSDTATALDTTTTADTTRDVAIGPAVDATQVAEVADGATGDVLGTNDDVSTEVPLDGVVSDAAGPSVDDNFGVTETEGRAVCDNLLPLECILPFPSDFFRRADATGFHVDLRGGVLPVSTGGVPMSAEPLLEADGFGIASPILIRLDGATLTGTAATFEPEGSLEPASRTVVLDATTGERVPHWVEADYLAQFATGAPLMVLRPARALDFGRRYIVAVRGLVDAAGAPVAPSPGFRALRDGAASQVRGIHARRAHFEASIFPALAAAGIARTELQLAFDFTTASETNSTGLFLAMRDALLAEIGAPGPSYTIDSVEANPDGHIAWRVTGHAAVPSFLLPPDTLGLRRVRRDGGGAPVIDGTESVEFTLQIPLSVAAAPGTAAVLQYGHGFLGTKGEATTGWLREFADRKGFVILAADMQGMSTPDTATWASNLLTDAGQFPVFSEAAMQGVLNHLALMRMMKGGFLSETEPSVSPDGQPVYDPTRLYYYGNSQGGTMGTLVMALTTDLHRGVLGVPGCAFPLLLHRSIDFSTWVGLLKGAYDKPMDLSLALALLGTGFNRIEPLAFATHLRDGAWPGSIPHEVLLQAGKEDAQVHTEVSSLLARRLGATLPTPSVQPVFGLTEAPYPTTGSAYVEFDFGLPDNPDPSQPPPKASDTHEKPRRSLEAQDQLWHFLETGEVISVCDGPCDPA
jgi:hypothetical protein